MIERLLNSEFLRFMIAGGLGAAANLGSRWIFSQFMSYEIAVALAYLVGMATAYLCFRSHVFEASGKGVHKEIFWFAVVNLAALAQVWLVSVGLYRYGLPAIGWTWHPDLVAHAIGVVSPIAVSYIGHKRLTFGREKLNREAL